jgi:orotate phosphoribosyltransferase
VVLEREVAEILLGIKAVTLRTDPPFKWASGILSPIYIDNRRLMSYPAERKTIVTCLARLTHNMGLKPDVIAGVATSGIPWASWVAESLSKPMIYVRPKAKDHGLKNLIEGKLKKGQKVLMIEDLISTGGSSVSAIETTREAGGIVDNCMAIFTYEFAKAAENFNRAKCRLITLSNFSTLVKVASEMGYVAKSEIGNVLKWSKDPEKWGDNL